ncbi:MAG: orotidine-5'-phosphate decarboxylase [Acidobacteria bacterium]|nr:MAG: orotidine-5'-phosphate decarboxylase [Acidobacteriota bacterium]
MRSNKRVIVALDVETSSEALELVSDLRDEAAAFKIGLQLFTAAGPDLVRNIATENQVFLDLKFHDIPNTVAKAGVEAARLGVWMFNVHVAGGSEMMRKTVADVTDFCSRENRRRPLILGVTVLTSSDANTLAEIGIERSTDAQVIDLANLASDCGLDGVVASPAEAARIRAAVDNKEFLIVTPGVRPKFATNDDQKRVTTPRQAILEGSDYLVIGRPILQAKDRVAELRTIREEIESAENG